MKIHYKLLLGLFTAFLTGCYILMPPTKNFRDQMDNYYVGRPLSEYTRVYTSAIIQEIKEVQPGVAEYFFEWGKGFDKPGKECKFVFVVEKNTEKIIRWRYNGNPDYCWITG